MTLEDLLTELDYADSPCFLRRGDGAFESELGYGHIFRRAQDPTDHKKPRWRAEGVYGIRDSADKSGRFIPVVYVCTAKDDAAAEELHRLLWNQDVAPYVIVHSVKGLRVYSGFDYTPGGKDARSKGVLQVLTEFNAAHAAIEQFSRTAVDEGRLWRHPDLRIDPSRRVYHRLLASLRELDKDLRNGGVSKGVSHALIGKYVYMHYLSARGILSEERLAKWGLTKAEIFGDGVKKSSLVKLTGHLDEWLNGEVFPLPWSGTKAPSAEAIRAVAGAFRGDVSAGGHTQPHLDFAAYDFSFIPIETLSLVYEQFLHAEDEGTDGKGSKGKDSKARKEGAYYTPLPLVNFVLAGLERQHPLTKGMKVLDPSSGSGSFLVQAYRLLIEKTFPDKMVKPKPAQLRTLLEESIFGCDVDSDACQVTQLSLLLTLLDYVDPPDLTGPMHSFKLPTLCETTNAEKLAAGHTPNILQRNFFGAEAALGAAVLSKQGAKAEWLEDGFDWIVGNPPWKVVSPKNLGKNDVPVWDWMAANAKKRPVGNNQAAQAFAWEAARYLKADGECALLVPAMGLFEEPSQEFRKAFFSQLHVHTVGNFSNFARILFDGRAEVPCAAISYCLRDADAADDVKGGISVYSPFVVNQEATRPPNEGERGKIWSLSFNDSEVRTLDFDEVATGNGLPWKLAMWGSSWDERLLQRMERKWPRLEELEARWDRASGVFASQNSSSASLVGLSEGLQLRTEPDEAENGLQSPPLQLPPRAKTLDMKALDSLRHVFLFPSNTTPQLEKRDWYGRGGRAKLPMAVCEPPHIIVHAARMFAVYSDEYIIVPARQVGIVSCTNDGDFLKALSLFLSSDFAFYHQFLRSTELGIKRDRATLEALRQMPIPLTPLSRAALRPWTQLHAKLAKCSPRTLDETKKPKADRQTDLFDAKDDNLDALLEEVNELTADALGLTKQERALIHDLVQVRYALNDGKRGEAAMRAPEGKELQAYARMLKEELDDFVGEEVARRHRITVVTDSNSNSAMVEIDFTTDAAAAKKPVVLAATDSEAKALRKTRIHLLKANGASQWAYFNRNLRIYKGRKTYVLKPMERHHWTSSSALTDANEIIAETLAGA